jgi:multicomponent Na+:H+ antiporter subunit E
MTLALMAVLLAVLWAAATDTFTLGNFVFGLLVGGLALYLVRDHVRGKGFLGQTLHIIALIWLFIRELMLSAIRVAILVLRPDMHMHLRAEMVEFPLTVTTDAEITLLANLITLTPGTLSVDVSEDRKILHIHALNAPDKEALIAEIRHGFEAAVARACR